MSCVQVKSFSRATVCRGVRAGPRARPNLRCLVSNSWRIPGFTLRSGSCCPATHACWTSPQCLFRESFWSCHFCAWMSAEKTTGRMRSGRPLSAASLRLPWWCRSAAVCPSTEEDHPPWTHSLAWWTSCANTKKSFLRRLLDSDASASPRLDTRSSITCCYVRKYQYSVI